MTRKVNVGPVQIGGGAPVSVQTMTNTDTRDVEAIRRKPVPREKEGVIHLIGLAAFFLLFIVLTYHDILRLITG